jgi:hypothetical protein
MEAAPIALDEQEYNTLLAALYAYQRADYGDPDKRPTAVHTLATAGGRQISMDAAGVTALFARLAQARAPLVVR